MVEIALESADTKLVEMVELVRAGEEIVFTDHGKPAARLRGQGFPLILRWSKRRLDDDSARSAPSRSELVEHPYARFRAFRSVRALTIWSVITPRRITVPTTAKFSELGMPRRLTRLAST